MISRKTAIELANLSERLVYTSVPHVGDLIRQHAQLGMHEMEIFVDKKIIKKCTKALDKGKYYYRIFEFEALPNECKLYVSWISNL